MDSAKQNVALYKHLRSYSDGPIWQHTYCTENSVWSEQAYLFLIRGRVFAKRIVGLCLGLETNKVHLLLDFTSTTDFWIEQQVIIWVFFQRSFDIMCINLSRADRWSDKEACICKNDHSRNDNTNERWKRLKNRALQRHIQKRSMDHPIIFALTRGGSNGD